MHVYILITPIYLSYCLHTSYGVFTPEPTIPTDPNHHQRRKELVSAFMALVKFDVINTYSLELR